jgi:hypothetical protein
VELQKKKGKITILLYTKIWFHENFYIIDNKSCKRKKWTSSWFFILTIGNYYYSPEQLIFIWMRSISRLYEYSFRNQWINQKVVFVHDKRFTVLLALTLEGYTAFDIMEGCCTKRKILKFYLEQVVSGIIYAFVKKFID